MELTLTPFQRVLIEKAILDKDTAVKNQEEIIDMIFAFHKVGKPTTRLSYADGKLSWAVTPESQEG